MNETLVKYLAGLLDADGSLSFSFKLADGHTYLGLTLSLASSDAIDTKNFVDALPKITGMGLVGRYGSKKQYKSWQIQKRANLEMLLPRLIKYMVIKGRHWQYLLEKWREHRGAKLSDGIREKLTADSKRSRIENAGSVKPKNHPSWAWLAGYLDGDGWYRYKYQKPPQNYWQINVGAVAHENDAAVLRFLQNSFGGLIFDHGQSENVKIWRRNLGEKDRDFALRFLPNLAKHSRLKRHKIDQIIHHHRQRLSVLSPTG